MPGAQCTRSLVCALGSKYAHEYSQRRHRITSGIPHAMVLTVSSVLSPATSSFLPPSSRGLKASRARSGRLMPPRDLTPATGARTTRLCRPRLRRSSCALLTAHEADPALPSRPRARHFRVHRILHPTFVTIAIRPSLNGTGCASCSSDLGLARSDLFSRRGLDRNFAKLPDGQISWAVGGSQSERDMRDQNSRMSLGHRATHPVHACYS
jgi:hypothetical protein